MHQFVGYASEFIDMLSKSDISKDLIVVINKDGTVSGYNKNDDFYCTKGYNGEWKSYFGKHQIIDLSDKIKPSAWQIRNWSWQYYIYSSTSYRTGWFMAYPTNNKWAPFKNKKDISTVYSTSMGSFVREDDRTVIVEDKDIFCNIN